MTEEKTQKTYYNENQDVGHLNSHSLSFFHF